MMRWRSSVPVILVGLMLAGCITDSAPPPVVAPPVAEAPPPPPPPPSPFPPARVTGPEAAELLANDPMATRFLVLRRLAEDHLIVPDAALGRMAANKGALLPLTEPLPPAAGLDRPLPPLEGIVERVRALSAGKGKGSDATRAAEGNVLLDAVLPAKPAKRLPLSPPDNAAARTLADRLTRLEDVGLITADEHAHERQAVEELITSGRLPEVLMPPPPLPSPPAKPAKAKPRRNFKPEFLPNPAGSEAPKLKAGSKEAGGIHLLSMAAGNHGEQAWTTLVKEYPELAALGYKVVKADLGDLGTTYRLIAGPLDAMAAERLCGALRGKGQSCMPTPFPP